MKKILQIFIIAFLILSDLFPQEKKPFSLNGYITTMQSVMFDSIKGTYLNENLIHNRLNLKTYIGNKITFGLEVRNRIFTGDMVENNPNYSSLIGSDPGFTDLSWNLINEKSILVNSTVDRCWLDFNYGKFQARAGRQRINWGQALVWNPNDIFNAYSVFDFDYVERPGSDAIRLQYYPGTASTAEVAIKADSKNNITSAGLYRFNKWGYDIQFLAGYFNGADYVAGAGWSGAMGSVSFRGEATWFQPAKHFRDTAGSGLLTVGFDKVFKNNSSAQIQIMYCNAPLKMTSFDSLYNGDLSSKDLAFSRFSAYGQATLQVNPLFNLSFSGMWLPDLNGYFAGASMDYSLAENLDFSLIWQNFKTEINSTKTRINFCFLRLKWSF